MMPRIPIRPTAGLSRERTKMADTYTVADLVAEFLQGCGVQTAFGIVSIHNMAMLDGIGMRNAIRFVPARRAAGAGSMADAHARVVGGDTTRVVWGMSVSVRVNPGGLRIIKKK